MAVTPPTNGEISRLCEQDEAILLVQLQDAVIMVKVWDSLFPDRMISDEVAVVHLARKPLPAKTPPWALAEVVF